ncbi:MAG TPA: four helix bundle protein [Desulfatiglandales bacterium]|nr:four helix bundle protein [Desulfatiglandales bacterium]
MARYEHLPIYKKAMDFTIYFEKIVRNFSRYNKYTLGSELRAVSRDILKLIIKANSSREKLPILYVRSKGLR